eukprot:767858-Hanusia_phi.AAC.7
MPSTTSSGCSPVFICVSCFFSPPSLLHHSHSKNLPKIRLIALASSFSPRLSPIDKVKSDVVR